MDTDIRTNCPNCGAPITEKICPYCGTILDKKEDEPDPGYPMLECDEVHPNFWNTLFPLIVFAGICYAGFRYFNYLLENEENKTRIFTRFIPLFFIILVSIRIILSRILGRLNFYMTGKKIRGKVYGYVDDTRRIHGIPTQICKILIYSTYGPVFAMYQLRSTAKPYNVNDELILKVKDDTYKIVKHIKHRPYR